jgi:hypothetical protein
MYQECPNCHLRYERAPGYFLGSTYVNYGFITLSMTVMYMLLHYGAGISNQWLAPPLIAYCTIVPLILFRYARSYWLAMDCYFDPTNFDESQDYLVRGAEVPRPPETPEVDRGEETGSR